VQGGIHELRHTLGSHKEILGGSVLVAGAGQLTIENGFVTMFNNLSGHYQFTPACLTLVGHNIGATGIDVADDVETNPWEG
ncbi:MAG: hypothetical protein AAGA30_07810, partial [Planctomycetota bacterium]